MDNLKLGIYCVVGNRIGELYRHAREILPDHSICVLSQYASRRVAETYPLFITNEDALLSQMDATARNSTAIMPPVYA